MSATVERVEDRLADFTRERRVLLLSLMALFIGALSAVVAKALVRLIALFTNITFYQKISSEFVSPAGNHLGMWVIVMPIVGGLIIGLTARYGSTAMILFGLPVISDARL